MNLSRIESIVTIIVTLITPLLTLLTWLVTREKFVDFWKKWFKTILNVALAVSAIMLSWRVGWLNWLSNTVTWPIWGLILFAVGVLLLPILIVLFVSFLENKKETNNEETSTLTKPDYYVIYGARWYFSKYDNSFMRPPVCANCLMEMRNFEMSEYFSYIESWECRKCGYKIRWDVGNKGDLLADIASHYNAELRHKQEVMKK